MEQAIREQYNERIFKELIGKYGIKQNYIKPDPKRRLSPDDYSSGYAWWQFLCR
jgi:hypothetical protein